MDTVETGVQVTRPRKSSNEVPTLELVKNSGEQKIANLSLTEFYSDRIRKNCTFWK